MNTQDSWYYYFFKNDFKAFLKHFTSMGVKWFQTFEFEQVISIIWIPGKCTIRENNMEKTI